MKVLGFPPKFTHLVMQCVKLASFSILVNGISKGSIVSSRGLYQRDSQSLYLFFIYTEGLVSLLTQSAQHGSLKGIRVCQGALMINHLTCCLLMIVSFSNGFAQGLSHSIESMHQCRQNHNDFHPKC